ESEVYALDTIPPTITAPPNIFVQSTGALTSVTLGTPTVTDNLDPSPTVTSNATASGYPIGTTTVTYTAKDAAGNIATATQKITVVVDNVPPTVIPPSDVVVTASALLTAVTLGTPTVTDNLDPSPTVTSNATASGYPIGTTTVTYTAKDAAGNIATATQKITINYPDSDADNISDNVDTQPIKSSNDFSDINTGGTTVGTISHRGGGTLLIIDKPDKSGIYIGASQNNLQPIQVS